MRGSRSIALVPYPVGGLQVEGKPVIRALLDREIQAADRDPAVDNRFLTGIEEQCPGRVVVVGVYTDSDFATRSSVTDQYLEFG